MNLPVAGIVDERFLNHRLHSTSLAGMIGGLCGLLLFGYRYYVNHIWSWDLFAVVATILGVKMVAMAYYRLTD